MPAAAAVFGVAALTDAADGHIARSRNMVTTFGRIADPLADKLLVGTALASLVILDRLALWIALVIGLREAGVALLRWHAGRQGIVLHVSPLGKAKTGLQMTAIVVLMLVPDPAAPWVTVLLVVVAGSRSSPGCSTCSPSRAAPSTVSPGDGRHRRQLPGAGRPGRPAHPSSPAREPVREPARRRHGAGGRRAASATGFAVSRSCYTEAPGPRDRARPRGGRGRLRPRRRGRRRRHGQRGRERAGRLPDAARLRARGRHERLRARDRDAARARSRPPAGSSSASGPGGSRSAPSTSAPSTASYFLYTAGVGFTAAMAETAEQPRPTARRAWASSTSRPPGWRRSGGATCAGRREMEIEAEGLRARAVTVVVQNCEALTYFGPRQIAPLRAGRARHRRGVADAAGRTRPADVASVVARLLAGREGAVERHAQVRLPFGPRRRHGARRRRRHAPGRRRRRVPRDVRRGRLRRRVRGAARRSADELEVGRVQPPDRARRTRACSRASW